MKTGLTSMALAQVAVTLADVTFVVAIQRTQLICVVDAMPRYILVCLSSSSENCQLGTVLSVKPRRFLFEPRRADQLSFIHSFIHHVSAGFSHSTHES